LHGHEIAIGRRFGAVFDHGEDFLTGMSTYCEKVGLRQGLIPMFLGAFAEVNFVGTCERVEDEAAPMWRSAYLQNVEVVGCGTIAYDEGTGDLVPHVHLSLGVRSRSAAAHTSHLLSARVQFIVEMVIVEVTSPRMIRKVSPDIFGLSLLSFQ
jgi:predicted DNA-binding protein with PD1-like motif